MENQKETFKITGENLLKKIKEIIAEGNVRRISILDKNEKEVLNFPLTIGVVGAVFLPVLAAVGALAAYMTECTVVVDRDADSK